MAILHFHDQRFDVSTLTNESRHTPALMKRSHIFSPHPSTRPLLALRWPLAIGCAAGLTALLLWGLVARYEFSFKTVDKQQTALTLLARLRLASTVAGANTSAAAPPAAQTKAAPKAATAQPATSETAAHAALPATKESLAALATRNNSPAAEPNYRSGEAVGYGLAWPPHGSTSGLGTSSTSALPTSSGKGDGTAATSKNSSANCFVQAQPTASDYPPAAVDDNIRRGRVNVRLSINADGIVEKTQVTTAQPAGYFERAAQRIALRWRCEPRAAPYTLIAPIEFELR